MSIMHLRALRTKLCDKIRKAGRAGVDASTYRKALAEVEKQIDEAFENREIRMQPKNRRVFHLTDEEYEKVKKFVENL